MENLKIYKQNSQPPKWALKEIQAGRLRGKTDINPQWRYQALTETFGLCGIGWKYEIKRTWLEAGANNEITANAEILLFIKQNDIWSEAIPGIGGASFISKEKNGMYTSDECYKMAITDALSVACKMLGIGSDIYAGKWDGSKYKTDLQPGTKEPSKPQPEEPKTLWLTEEQFNAALNSDIKGIEATLKAYSFTKGKAMKKDYKLQLENKLKELKDNGSK